jgi:hypothetical protein
MNLISDRVGMVIMRPHPSEPEGKYDWVHNVSSVPVRISSETSLLDDLAIGDVVIGCESMAMVIAVLAHKRVVCSIPPGGRPCALPYEEIESLQEIVRARHG